MGIEHTYKDTYKIIKKQFYINEYEIFSNQKIEVDLNSWRKLVTTILNKRINEIYSNEYGINWGINKWLFFDITNPYFSNKVLINTTKTRFPNSSIRFNFVFNGSNLNFSNLQNEYGSNLIFIGNNEEEYEYFKEKTGMIIEYYKPNDFLELCTAIASCKLFIGSYSAPLAIASAMDVNRIPKLYYML